MKKNRFIAALMTCIMAFVCIAQAAVVPVNVGTFIKLNALAAQAENLPSEQPFYLNVRDTGQARNATSTTAVTSTKKSTTTTMTYSTAPLPTSTVTCYLKVDRNYISVYPGDTASVSYSWEGADIKFKTSSSNIDTSKDGVITCSNSWYNYYGGTESVTIEVYDVYGNLAVSKEVDFYLVQVTTTCMPDPDIYLESIPSSECYVGNTVQLDYYIYNDYYGTTYIEFSSSNTSVAKVSDDGYVTFVGSGTVTITARVINSYGGSDSDSITLKVSEMAVSTTTTTKRTTTTSKTTTKTTSKTTTKLTSTTSKVTSTTTRSDHVRLSPVPTYECYVGNTVKVSYYAPSGSNTWNFSSSDTSVARIDDRGYITFVGEGTVTITISGASIYGEYETDSMTLYVYPPIETTTTIVTTTMPPPEIHLYPIPSSECYVGNSVRLSYYTGGYLEHELNIEFVSSNTSVAKVSNGYVTFVGEGSVTIVARASNYYGYDSDSITLNVFGGALSTTTTNRVTSTTNTTTTKKPTTTSSKTTTTTSKTTTSATTTKYIISYTCWQSVSATHEIYADLRPTRSIYTAGEQLDMSGMKTMIYTESYDLYRYFYSDGTYEDQKNYNSDRKETAITDLDIFMIDGKVSKLSDFSLLPAGRYAINGSKVVSVPDNPGTSKLFDFEMSVTIIPRYGDANGDCVIDISDAVLIMQVLANPDKYDVGGYDKEAMTERGRINADCYAPGSDLTAMDALTIQKYLLNSITMLPDGQ